MRNQRSVQFSMASMSDLVFLLLIFFMLTSTLIAPQAIKLLLPTSESRTLARQTVTVYINEQLQVFLEENPVDLQPCKQALYKCWQTKQQHPLCCVPTVQFPFRILFRL